MTIRCGRIYVPELSESISYLTAVSGWEDLKSRLFVQKLLRERGFHRLNPARLPP